MSLISLPLPTSSDPQALLDWANSLVAVLQGEYADGAATSVIYDTSGRIIVGPEGLYAFDPDGTNWMAPDIVTIDTSKLADAAVTTNKLANLAVDVEKLADLAVTAAKISTGAVQESKIIDAAVTELKIAAGAVSTDRLADLAVNAAKLANLAVTTAKLADNAITAPKIDTAAVTETKLFDAAVTTSKLADSAVVTSKLATAAVDTTKLADLAVDAAKLATSAVTATKIANAAVGTAAIANLAVGTAQIADLAVQTAKIADLAVTDAKIDTLTANKITAGTIGAHVINIGSGSAAIQIDGSNRWILIADDQATPQTRVQIGRLGVGSTDYGIYIYDAAGNLVVGNNGLGTGVVDSAQIVNAAVGAAAIADLAVGTAKIADAAITSVKIGSAAVGSAAIASAAVGTAHIANAAIITALIADAAIVTAKIDDLAVNGAKIANLAVTNAKINDLSADKINAGTLSADRIGAGSIDATKLSVSQLNLISGILTGGTDTVLVDTTNNRITIGDETYGGTGIQLEYNSGSPRVHIGSTTSYLEYLTSTDALLARTLVTAASGQRVELNPGGDNELHFYSDRGDGTIEELGTLGRATVGSDYYLLTLGSANLSGISGLYVNTANAGRAATFLAYDTATTVYIYNTSSVDGASALHLNAPNGSDLLLVGGPSHSAHAILAPSRTATPTHNAKGGSLLATLESLRARLYFQSGFSFTGGVDAEWGIIPTSYPTSITTGTSLAYGHYLYLDPGFWRVNYSGSDGNLRSATWNGSAWIDTGIIQGGAQSSTSGSGFVGSTGSGVGDTRLQAERENVYNINLTRY